MKKRRSKPLPDERIVMHDYQASKALRDHADIGALHMFFSPNRVPTGLTDKEALLCIALSPLKLAWQERIRQKLKSKVFPSMPKNEDYSPEFLADMYAASRPIMLPAEFNPGKDMTRRRFRIGIDKLLEAMLIA